MAKVGEGTLNTSLPSENALLGILLMNGLYILTNVIKTLIAWKEKRDDKTEEKVDLALTKIGNLETHVGKLETMLKYFMRGRGDSED